MQGAGTLTLPKRKPRRARIRLLDVAVILFLVGLALLLVYGRQPPEDETLLAIKQRGVLRVGVDASYPPFENVQGDQYVGFDIDLATRIAGHLGVKKVEYANIGFDGLYDALGVKRVDILVSGLPQIPEYRKAFSYSTPYFDAGQVLVRRQGQANLRSIADLAGKTVAVELGSSGDTEARRLTATVPELKVDSTYHAPDDALTALKKGLVDAAIVDSPSALGFMRREGGVEMVGEQITSEPYYVVVRADDHQLLEEINLTIATARTNGDLARLADKWF